jgi:hypothetical protein
MDEQRVYERTEEIPGPRSNDERTAVLRGLVLAESKGERSEGWCFVPTKYK